MLEVILDINQYPTGWDKLKQNVEVLEMVDEDSKPTSEQVDEYIKLGFYDGDVAKPLGSKDENEVNWYQLLRNAQGSIWINGVFEGMVKHQIDYENFIKNSLLCEWGYIINLDKMILEVYKGFQKKPQLKGNRYTLEPDGKPYEDNGYFACKLIKKIRLTDVMSTGDVEKFINDLIKKDR